MIALVLVLVGIVVNRISPTDTSNLPLNNDPSFSPCHSKHIKEMKFSDITHYS